MAVNPGVTPLPLSESETRRAVFTLRVIWFALLMGQVMFLAVILFGPPIPAQGNPPQNLVWVAGIMLLVIVPVAFLIRRFMTRPDAEGLIPAGKYSAGNIVFWAGCETVGFFALVVVFQSRQMIPVIYVVALVWALHILTFPRAAALRR